MKFQWEKKSFFLGALLGAIGVLLFSLIFGFFWGHPDFPANREFQRNPASGEMMREGQERRGERELQKLPQN